MSISDPVSVYSSSSSSESVSGFFTLAGVSREASFSGGTLEDEEDTDCGRDGDGDGEGTMAEEGTEREKWSSIELMGGEEGGDER